MGDSRQAKIRTWSLAVAAFGLALWIGSIAVPYLFGDDRGWDAAQSKAYEDAGANLHALLEGTHDHDDMKFESEEAAQAYAASHREHVHQHVDVDPKKLLAAKAEFDLQKANLESVRSTNRLQVGMLFWCGVGLMCGGILTFFAANRAEDG